MMEKKQQEFLKRLRETFRVEADEHLRTMSAGILKLEQGLAADDRAAMIEVVFREVHSLKGAARAVNLIEIESICQSLEGIFSAVKCGENRLSQPLCDRIHAAFSLIGDLIPTIGAGQGTADESRVAQMVRELGESLREFHTPPSEENLDIAEEETLRATKSELAQVPTEVTSLRRPEKDALPILETVRISTTKLNAIFLQSEVMVSAKLALGQRVAEMREVTALMATWEKARAKVQPELRALLRGLEKSEKGNGNGSQPPGSGATTAAVAKVAVFSQLTEHAMKSIQAKMTLLVKSAEQDRRTLSNMVDRLLDDTRKAMMLPFTSILEAIPKLVRDLARDEGKDVGLVIQGSEIEVDRRILEEMKDPLVHLVRNCVDHGIERPRERERKKKPGQGVITIAISQKDGGKVEVLVSDDGAGIRIDGVRASGLKSGAVSQKEAGKMDNAAIVSLIFQSGVTTSPIVTDISGRGLGLAIIREKVDKLGGSVSVETRPDMGTTFRMVLPLTLAAFRGVLVRSDDQLLIVPSVQVVHTLRIRKDQIKSVENREAIDREGKVISLVRLGSVLGIPRKAAPGKVESPVYIMVLSSADQLIAFVVDEIMGEEEVLVKSLGQELPPVRSITGAAVLGTGKVVPVLNVYDLMQFAAQVGTTSAPVNEQVKPSQGKQGRILVAEDSITTRTLLKNILQSAGYTAKTAVDGVDALTSLRVEEFDLVVSDVDMPRMNGFGLTAAIRADKKLTHLPVVLVTALESREDRERGIDVGANAYIVKSSFEQSNLLEVVGRLI